MTAFTKSEREAIDKAWRAVTYICETTNWSDAPQFREAFKLERKETKDATAAKAMICKAWHEGFTNPNRPVSEVYWIRSGYLMAMLLGVRHAHERANHPRVPEALAACPAAIAANDAHTSRLVDGIMNGKD